MVIRHTFRGLTARLIIITVIFALLLVAIFITKSWQPILFAPALLLLGVLIKDRFQHKHAILRNYPVIGRVRYLAELVRPEIRQYFVESDTDGKPFSRRQRSLVYQRAKDVKDTIAFGSQLDAGKPGYEWVEHSIFPVKVDHESLRVTIGTRDCHQPYSSSLLNISAMSFGALSKTAIEALGQGARMGGFALNTGEGGISPYHEHSGADLIWQIGTGYFGCRSEDGTFSDILFAQRAALSRVKMIEIKLSQGAKPGKGGLLPAVKNTPEIAHIRNITPWTDVISPAGHSAFTNAFELLQFIAHLRKLSKGKPVGIKLCVGRKEQVEELFSAMLHLDIIPDFITVDGSEGGTGAAPLEFADHIGMPLHNGLALVSAMRDKYGLREDTKLIAAGKIVSGFDMIKALALGADLCYSARGMMMALGCIQALQCDSGKCPVGIATQDNFLAKGIVVTDKRVRVRNFHENTMKALAELMGACGFKNTSEILPSKIYRRIDNKEALSLAKIYFTHLEEYRESRTHEMDPIYYQN